MAENNISNTALIAAINALKQDNSPENRTRMMNEIMSGRYIVPALAEGDTQDGQQKFRVALIENKQTGEKYIPAFTDNAELSKMKTDGKLSALVMDFDGLANALLMPKSEGNGLAFNPFGNNVVLDKKTVVSLRMKRQQLKQSGDIKAQTVPSNTQIALGIPKEQPTALLNAISQYLKTQPNVTAAYLRLMKQNENVSLLIIVDGIISDYESLFKGMFNAARGAIIGKMKLSFTFAQSELGQKAIENIEPFYIRVSSEIMS